MKLVAIFGLIAGAIVALGQMSAAQWHAIGLALLALALRYGLIVLPWLLAGLLAVLWWRERKRRWLYEEIAIDEQTRRQQYGARVWELERAAEKRPAQRRRATR